MFLYFSLKFHLLLFIYIGDFLKVIANMNPCLQPGLPVKKKLEWVFIPVVFYMGFCATFVCTSQQSFLQYTTVTRQDATSVSPSSYASFLSVILPVLSVRRSKVSPGIGPLNRLQAVEVRCAEFSTENSTVLFHPNQKSSLHIFSIFNKENIPQSIISNFLLSTTFLPMSFGCMLETFLV